MVCGHPCPSEVALRFRAPAAVRASACRPPSGALSPLRLASSLAAACRGSSTKRSGAFRSMGPARLSVSNSSRNSSEAGSAGKAQEAV